MGSEIIQRKAFINYLHKDLEFTEGSANSYATYIAQVSKYFDFNDLFIHVNKFIEDGDSFKVSCALVDLRSGLYETDIHSKLGVKETDVRKWISALQKYEDFLCQQAEANCNYVQNEDDSELEENKDAIPDFSTVNSSNIDREWIFDREELYRNFIFRIITQDRYNEECFFPISLTKKIMYENSNREFFDSWVEKLIGGIKIHTSEGEIDLSSITHYKIRIDSNSKVENYVDCSGNELFVFSKTADGLLDVMGVDQLRSVAIDHIEPMKSIMLKSKDKLPMHVLLTNKMIGINRGKITNKRMKLAGRKLLELESFDMEFVDKLKSELIYLLPMMKLQLMNARENIRKGAN